MPDNRFAKFLDIQRPAALECKHALDTLRTSYFDELSLFGKKELNFFSFQIQQNNQPGAGSGKKRGRTPPPSQFQHLGPSRNRYTILHDEF